MKKLIVIAALLMGGAVGGSFVLNAKTQGATQQGSLYPVRERFF